MTRLEKIHSLNNLLLCDMPQYREEAAKVALDAVSQRRLLRSLMNLRPPMPLDADFLREQDALLCTEREEKGIIAAGDLAAKSHPQLFLWQGDITRLSADSMSSLRQSQFMRTCVSLICWDC